MADDLPPGMDPSTVSANPAGEGALPPGMDPSTLTVAPSGPPANSNGRYSLPALFGWKGPAAQQQYISDVKDVGRGVAEQITGLGELVPGLHESAAAASKSLGAGVKDPKLATLGGLVEQGAEFAFPAGKMAHLVGDAPEAAGWLTRVERAMGRGVLGGGAYGVLSGFQTPTGDPNFESALKKKASAAAEWGIGGAVVGAGLEGAGSLARSGAQLAGRAVGKELNSTAEAFRSRGAEAVGAARTAEEARAAEAARKAAEASAALPKVEQELGRTGRAIESIKGRAPDRLTGEPGLPSREEKREAAKALGHGAPAHDETAEIRARVVERTERRVTEAKKVAEAQGLREEEAREFVDLAKERAIAAEQAADELAKEVATRPGVTRVELGAKVQRLVDKLIDKYETIRREKSGISKIIADTKGVKNIETDKISGYIAKQKAEVIRDPEQRRILDSIDAELKNVINEGGVSEGGATVSETPHLSLAQADNLRMSLNRMLNQKQVSIEGKALGIDKHTAGFIRDIQKLLSEAVESKSAAYTKALKKYADLSRPLDELTGRGALGGVDKEMQYGDEFQMEAGAVVTRLMSKSKEGNEVVKQLIDESPSLKVAIKNYLTRELFGPTHLPKEVSASRVRDFIRENEELITHVNITKTFNTILDKLSGSEAEVQAAKDAIRDAEERVKGTQDWTRYAEKGVQSQESLHARALERLGKPTPPEKLASAADKEAKERAKRALAKLTEQQQGAKAKATELQSTKTASEKEAEAAKTLSENYAKQWSALTDTNTSPRKAAEAIKSLTKDLREKGHLTAEQERDFDAQARDIITKYEDQAKARGLLKALAIAVATAGAAYAGVRGSEAISGVNVFFPHSGRH